jgi:biotin carboxylase
MNAVMPPAGEQPVVGSDSEVAGKRLLILGGGLWQRDYVRRARALGLETWVTDWRADAVAREDADHFFPIDLKNAAATLELARDARVDGVMTPADIGVTTAAHVAAALGLPGPTPALAKQSTNKLDMRRRAADVALPVPWFEPVRSVGTAVEMMTARTWPVIVKPVDNCSSRGVRVVHDRAALETAVDAALAASLEREAIVEQFLQGVEGSLEAFVQAGEVTVLGVCDKTKSPLPDRYDLELRYPGAYSAAVSRNLADFIERLVRGFEITDALLHVEFLIPHGTDEVFLTEFALRGCGSKVVTHLLPQLTGVDVVGAAIRQALGLKTALTPTGTLHGALHFLMFPPGRVARVHGLDEARSVPGVIDVCVERLPGEQIEPVHDGRSRPGHLLVHGPSRSAVQATIAAVRSAVRVEFDDHQQVAPACLPAAT